jgi:hypothetical protein
MVNGDITVRGGLTRDDTLAFFPHKPESRARGGMCPAMSQQRTDIGNEAAPQKLIRLIGYRDSRRTKSAAPVSPTLAPRT